MKGLTRIFGAIAQDSFFTSTDVINSTNPLLFIRLGIGFVPYFQMERYQPLVQALVLVKKWAERRDKEKLSEQKKLVCSMV